MPKAVLWDIGNVIVRWNPRTLYSQIFEDPAECDRFLSDVCNMVWHVRHDFGVTSAENRLPLLEAFPHYSDQIHAWETRWWDMFSGVIAETEDVIHALAERGVPQFGLSNMSDEVFPGVRAMSPAFAHLSDVLISADVKMIKPQPDIFALLQSRYALAPARTVFIDDLPANVDAARVHGWHAIHFESASQLEPQLAAHID